MFGDLKNFKNLKETGIVKDFNKADTVIYDVDIEWNEKVENSLIYLQTVARNKFNTYLERSGAYIPLMEKILKERGLPHDLVYLPLIESGFNASAYSYARASGFWQFISSTGKLYGLDHNWWYDERRDFEKATIAAAEHLKDFYELFGSWNLALAAYNGGAGRVSREIKKAKTNDFWKLSLHSQTKAYVPLFMAATIIAKQPNKYGFFPEYQTPIEFDTVHVDKCVSFNNISAKTGIAVGDLERLNPELLRGITPPKASDYRLRLPMGSSESFVSVYNDLPAEKAKTLDNHRVRKGETLSVIAKKYGTSVAAIIELNGLSKKQRIMVGQLLTVPVSGVSYTSDPEPSKVVSNYNSKSQPGGEQIARPNRYLIKHGDTLWEIATAHGVSIYPSLVAATLCRDANTCSSIHSPPFAAARRAAVTATLTVKVGKRLCSFVTCSSLTRCPGGGRSAASSMPIANWPPLALAIATQSAASSRRPRSPSCSTRRDFLSKSWPSSLMRRGLPVRATPTHPVRRRLSLAARGRG